jgi:hypothetical protein
VVDARAIEVGERGDKQIATMTATVMTVLGRDGVHH